MNTELKIKDIKDIGPAAVKKLKDADILTVQDLATQSIEMLSASIGCGKDLANKYIQNAHTLLREHDMIPQEIITGKQALIKRELLLRVTTSSSKLDTFLYGGIETGAITELHGEYGSGKSQLCHQLSVNCSLPVDQKGLNGSVIFIDTENTFRPERIKQIAMERGYDVDAILENVKLCKVQNSGYLEYVIDNIGRLVEEHKSKMVIVDSIIALHRGDYSGRGTLADRQQKMNAIMHRLLRVAELYELAVIITNQVTTSPDTFFGDPTKATGGNIIGHASTYRLYLKKAGKVRKARMIDSPYHEVGECMFNVSAKGIIDVEGE